MGYDDDDYPRAQRGQQLYPPPSAPPSAAFDAQGYAPTPPPPMRRPPQTQQPSLTSSSSSATAAMDVDAVPWHERQRVWRTMGLVVGSVGGAAAVTGVQPLLVSLVGSAAPAFAVGLAGASPLAPLAWTLGGAAAVVVGIKMWARRCYRDPEAVRAYYIDFCQRGFLAAAADHDFEQLLRIATPEGMAAKLLEEMAALPPGFDVVWQTYGEAHLTQIVRARVLTQDYLCAKLAHDHPDPELDLPVGDGPAIDLIRAMRAYGRWLTTHLDVSPAWIRHRFARDERMRNLAFSQFVAEGGMALHPNAAAKLIGRGQLRGMFWRELQHKDWTFKRVKELCASWLFARDPQGLADDDATDDQEDEEGVYTERSLIKPEELAELFHKEIVSRDLCDLLDLYWHWPLSEHGGRLVPDSELLGKLRLFQARYEKVIKADADERRQVKDRYKRERQAAQAIHDTKASAAHRAYGEVKAKYEKLTTKPQRLAQPQPPKSATPASEPMEVDGDTTEPVIDPVEAKKAERKLAKARSKRDSATDAARLELTLLTTVLESDRDDRLRAVDGRLRADKERLNAEWVEQREPHLHPAEYPAVLHFPAVAPAPAFAPFPAAFAPSAPPIETHQQQQQHQQVNYFNLN